MRRSWLDLAAILLVAAGDNPERLKNEAAFARLCGVAPLEASSGKVVRHRLNRGGNRQANHALYRIILSRLSSDAETKRYVAGVRYSIWANTAPTDTNRAHPAAILTVEN